MCVQQMTIDHREYTLARSVFYRFLALSFLYPEETLLAVLREQFLAVESALACFLNQSNNQDIPLAASWLPLKTSLSSTPVWKLQEEYLRVFSYTISQECPPYETQYGSKHIFQQTQAMSDIAGFYRAFGLEESRQRPERCDHISLELEFMYFLIYKQAHALSQKELTRAEICREAEHKFFAEHVGRWVPSFTMLLERKAEEGYLHDLACFTRVFFRAESDYLGLYPVPLPQMEKVFYPPPAEEGCFSCGGEGVWPVREDRQA